jgi:hypothetical protein
MQAPPPALARPETIAPPPSLPPLPPPPLEKPVEAARPAPPLARVSREAEDEPADGPVGDWQTEGRGLVRIVRCGVALCGYVLNASSNDRGEAVLVNMKPKTDTQWTGHVYSQASGDSYYGTMTMRGTSTLRVEACALGRFYCTGNLWARTGASAERIVTSRQAATEPRS